jgi:predicted RNA-binding Zn ribbon-like protein
MELIANILDVEADELTFRFGAGSVALDLVATVGERGRRSFERLRTPGDLAGWLVGSELLQDTPDPTEKDLMAVRRLRADIFLLVTATMTGDPLPTHALERVNEVARLPDMAPQLRPNRSLGVAGQPATQRALSTLARDAITLLATCNPERLRECASANCSRLYIDRSRPGNRVWCSSTGCGNRARTKAYRRRRNPEGE